MESANYPQCSALGLGHIMKLRKHTHTHIYIYICYYMLMNRLYPLIMFQRKQPLTNFQCNLKINRTHFYESGSPLSTIVNPQSHPLTLNTPCLSQIELCNWSWGNFAPESIMAMTFADHRSRIPENDQASNMHEHV